MKGSRTLNESNHHSRRRISIWAIALLVVGGADFSLSFLPHETIDAMLATLEPDAMSAPVDAGGSEVVREVLDQRESDSGQLGYAPLNGQKLSGILCVFGIVFLVNGFILIAASRLASPRPRIHIFPFAIASSLVIMLVGYRTVIGAGIGLDQVSGDSPKVASGIILNYVDNLSYASWAAQAAEGQWTFEVLYTTEEHDAVYVNPFFVFVGCVAHALNLPVLTVLHAAGLFAAFITVICVYYITVLAGLPVSAARWAAFLTAFSSGLSSFMTLLHALFGIPLLLGVDVIYLESIMFTTFFCWPYQACMLSLLAIAILCITVCETKRGGWSKSCFIALPFISLLLASGHPYDGLMLFGSYFVFVCLSRWFTVDHSDWRRRLLLLCLVAATVIPVTVYSFWVSKQPVWDHFAEVALGEWRPRWAWLIGYGLTLPLGIAGAIRCLRLRESAPARWIAVWTLLVIVLLVGINVNRTTKLCNGGHLPMCIAAGVACAALMNWVRQICNRGGRVAAYAVGCAAVALMTSTCMGMLLYGFRTHTYERGLTEVAGEIKQNASGDRFPAVLCDVRSARILTVVGPTRTYTGHYALTPDYHAKREELIQVGVQADQSGELRDPIAEGALERLLTKAKVDFLLIRQDAPARRAADESTNLRLIKQIELWRLYKVISAKSSNADRHTDESSLTH